MTPSFALSLSIDGICLFHRAHNGWRFVAMTDVSAPEMDKLRMQAVALEAGDLTCKLIIPNDQIKYMTIETGHQSMRARHKSAYAALIGATPYQMNELAFDIAADGPYTHIAAVAKETLREAETFTRLHKFAPISFVSLPDENTFCGEPNFGPTQHAVDFPEATAAHKAADDLRWARSQDAQPASAQPQPFPTQRIQPDLKYARHMVDSLTVTEPGQTKAHAKLSALTALTSVGQYLREARLAERAVFILAPPVTALHKWSKRSAFAITSLSARSKITLAAPVLVCAVALSAWPYVFASKSALSPIATADQNPMINSPQVTATQHASNRDQLSSGAAPLPARPEHQPSSRLSRLSKELSILSAPTPAPDGITNNLYTGAHGTIVQIWQPEETTISVFENLAHTAPDLINLDDRSFKHSPISPNLGAHMARTEQTIDPAALMHHSQNTSDIITALPRVSRALAAQGNFPAREDTAPILPSHAHLSRAQNRPAPPQSPPPEFETQPRNVAQLPEAAPELPPHSRPRARTIEPPPASQPIWASARPRTIDRSTFAASAQISENIVRALKSGRGTITPRRASSNTISRAATTTNAITLRKVNLIGVTGTSFDRSALVLLSNGNVRKVKVGDQIDGGRVIAIGDAEVRYRQNNRNITLKMPIS